VGGEKEVGELERISGREREREEGEG
jgi:hypothetical protein